MTPGLRIRLTALYGGLFALFVGLLMVVSYVLMRGHLDRTLPPDEADAALEQLGTQYAIALAGATLVATALGWALAGRELASAERAFEARERFAANASHELRSPLTVIRTEVDVALADPDAGVAELRAMGEDVLETVDRMDGLLDDLMLLVRSGGALPRREPVDLAAVAGAAARRAGDGPVSLEVELRPVTVRGERRLLERLAENLVENGVRYNEPDGFVSVQTRSCEGGNALLRVVNSGPRVDAERAARLLEPFERGGRARDDGGAGLGLSIVRAVAEAHGGRVALAPRPRGRVDGRCDAAARVARALGNGGIEGEPGLRARSGWGVLVTHSEISPPRIDAGRSRVAMRPQGAPHRARMRPRKRTRKSGLPVNAAVRRRRPRRSDPMPRRRRGTRRTHPTGRRPARSWAPASRPRALTTCPSRTVRGRPRR